MSFLSTTLIAFSMSADAFAVAASKGAALRRPKLSEALRTGAIFGFIEFLTPLAGWCLGYVASSYVAAVDHWISFAILGAIGGKMLWESVSCKNAEEDKAKPRQHSLAALAIAGVGSSLDALAVGVTLAFINADILVTAAAIGAATFLMASLGTLVGRWAGAKLGRAAEAIGGVTLIAIGSFILLEHLGLL